MPDMNNVPACEAVWRDEGCVCLSSTIIGRLHGFKLRPFVYAPIKMVDSTFQFASSSFSGIRWNLVESTIPSGGDKRESVDSRNSSWGIRLGSTKNGKLHLLVESTGIYYSWCREINERTLNCTVILNFILHLLMTKTWHDCTASCSTFNDCSVLSWLRETSLLPQPVVSCPRSCKDGTVKYNYVLDRTVM